jgi:LEA14-like dessication related protein
MHQFGRSIVLLLLGSLISACEYLPQSAQPEITSVSPRIQGLALDGVDLIFDLGIKNPYPVPIKTPKFRYNFAVAETPLFSGKEVPGADLPARKIGNASLPVRVKYTDIFNLAGRLRDANEAGYKLDGAFLIDAVGKNFELPFAHNGTFPIFKLPKISVQSFKPTEVSLTSAEFLVDANITNPNSFPIGLGDLRYVLQLGDLELGRVGVRNLRELAAGGNGNLSIAGETSASNLVRDLVAGRSIGGVRVLPLGTLETPFGPVRLPGSP